MKPAAFLAPVFFLAAMTSLPAAEPKRAECEPESRQFDFWVGRWSVTDRGKHAGTNHIEKVLGGCALIENWKGAAGGEGKSLNFYDRTRGQWHQTWIDASGGALYLSGRFENGAMRLEGRSPASGDTPPGTHRITWTPLPGGAVRQLWESRADGSEAWQVVFDGHYTPLE